MSASSGAWRPPEVGEPLPIDLNAPFTAQLLGALKDNLQRAEDAMARRLIIMLVLALIYFLVLSRSLTTVSIGVTEISDLRVIELLLPVVFAYTYMSTMTIGAAGFALLNGIRSILHTQGASSTIGVFVPADGPLAYQLHMLDESDSTNHRAGFFFVVAITFARLIVYAILPLVFLIFCLAHTFGTLTDLVAWSSIIGTSILTLLAVPTLVVYAIADRNRFL